MAKRLNPHRRLLAAQARALMGVRMEQSAAHGAEMAKLQQGHVRSAISRSNPLRHRKYVIRPHSKFGNEPPVRRRIPGSAKVNRTIV